MHRFLTLAVVALCATGCATSTAPDPAAPAIDAAAISRAMDAIDAAGLTAHVKVLSSDEFEGRAPASAGEEKTVRYLEREFTRLGFRPGNGDSFFQEVPLVAITAERDASLHLKGPGYDAQLVYGRDMMVWTKRVVTESELAESEVVFVGYGIVAPEYGWNDYQGLDVTGKTVVMLVNDPGYATQDPALFRGNAMTYYGRWTYKYEEAARQGAAGVLVIHETGPAGYPWEVVSGGWSGPEFDLVNADRNMSRCAIEGWITDSAADALFRSAGWDYATAKKAAMTRGFRPHALNVTASVAVKNTLEESLTRNVVAVLPGRERPEDFVVHMAHWDHLGKDETLAGDQIYNGAVDNATGTAALLELAQAYMALPVPPARSVALVAVAAEESGLLGSRYLAENPIFPLSRTVAAINMDSLNVYGRTRDVAVIGFGSSELENYLAEAAAMQGRLLVQEPTPEKGFFYRSDHFNFAKQGVPVLYAKGGDNYMAGGADRGAALKSDYVSQRYHKPGDEYDPNWDLSGAVEDMQLYFMVGVRLANEDTFPNWFKGNEFRATRDASRR